tara:strand:+ start:3670 stop:3873 length:204 start_codon:yes stop_codon:yes gene_type:complete
MGHYDDAREAYEDRQDQQRADRLGITVEEMHVQEKHHRDYTRGRELFIKREAEQKLIDIYLAGEPTQ